MKNNNNIFYFIKYFFNFKFDIKKHKSYVKLTRCKKKFNKKDYRLI